MGGLARTTEDMSAVSAAGHIGRTIRGDRRGLELGHRAAAYQNAHAAVRRLFTSHALHRNRLRNANA